MRYEKSIENSYGKGLDPMLNEIPPGDNETNLNVNEKCSEESSEENEEPHQYSGKEEIMAALKQAYENDKYLQEKLLHYTLKKIYYYTYTPKLKGKDADDVLQIVFEKIINGKRKWNKVKVPNIIEFVLMVIHSLVRNESKKIECEVTVEDFDDMEKLAEQNLVDLIRESTRRDVEDEIFRKTHEELIDKCLAMFENDITAYFVFEELLEGEKSNINIADKLGITVNKVSNAKRRIKATIQKEFDQNK